jgi:hypothetical protein
MANDDKAKAIAKVALEVAEVAISSGSGCAYAVQRDADKNPEVLLLFCDKNSVDLAEMIEAVEGVTEGWFSAHPGRQDRIAAVSRFLLWAMKSGRVLLNREEETPATLLADFLKFERARVAVSVVGEPS